ncbi:hypothetical protein ACWEVO_37145, partial [Micromonospora sp. NPDC003776]
MISVVVPTLGRPSLGTLLDALAGQLDELPDPELLLVDDRRQDAGEETGELAVPGALAAYTKVLTGRRSSCTRGRAAARSRPVPSAGTARRRARRPGS